MLNKNQISKMPTQSVATKCGVALNNILSFKFNNK